MWLTLKLHGGFNKEFKQLLGFLQNMRPIFQNTQVIQTMANLVPQIAEILVKISF